MFFNATTAKLFKQCGIYDEMMSIAKLTPSINIANENREIEYTLDFSKAADMYVNTLPEIVPNVLSCVVGLDNSSLWAFNF
jgi:hypothetical protein